MNKSAFSFRTWPSFGIGRCCVCTVLNDGRRRMFILFNPFPRAFSLSNASISLSHTVLVKNFYRCQTTTAAVAMEKMVNRKRKCSTKNSAGSSQHLSTNRSRLSSCSPILELFVHTFIHVRYQFTEHLIQGKGKIQWQECLRTHSPDARLIKVDFGLSV